jgi:hypothetical protein
VILYFKSIINQGFGRYDNTIRSPIGVALSRNIRTVRDYLQKFGLKKDSEKDQVSKNVLGVEFGPGCQ